MHKGALCGLTAALLFGLSAPLSKLLLPHMAPLMLASLLYLGAGLALSMAALARRRPVESPLQRDDAWPLAAIVITGGMLGPLLMLAGLQRVSALCGSLLLNLEAPLTILLAVTCFGDHLGRRAAGAAACILGGAMLLSWAPGEVGGNWRGAAFIFLGCLAWAVDNNLTQQLSLRDPLALTRMKTLSAGLGSLLLSAMLGLAWPPLKWVGVALIIGAFSYGVSILLDTYALRILGAAREAAWFATAPFLGALLSMPLTAAPLRWIDAAAGVLMAIGAGLLLTEKHGHGHQHDAMTHEHRHRHDVHHHHAHDHPVSDDEEHSHAHTHVPLWHDHPHTPDAHHRHSH